MAESRKFSYPRAFNGDYVGFSSRSLASENSSPWDTTRYWLRSTASIQYRRVTNGRTDRQTPIIARAALA